MRNLPLIAYVLLIIIGGIGLIIDHIVSLRLGAGYRSPDCRDLGVVGIATQGALAT